MEEWNNHLKTLSVCADWSQASTAPLTAAIEEKISWPNTLIIINN